MARLKIFSNYLNLLRQLSITGHSDGGGGERDGEAMGEGEGGISSLSLALTGIKWVHVGGC
jgi:hypothetical protein